MSDLAHLDNLDIFVKGIAHALKNEVVVEQIKELLKDVIIGQNADFQQLKEQATNVTNEAAKARRELARAEARNKDLETRLKDLEGRLLCTDQTSLGIPGVAN